MLGAASSQVAFNFGNAIGAYCGGFPPDHGYPYTVSALVGAGFAFLAFLIMCWFYRYTMSGDRFSPKQTGDDCIGTIGADCNAHRDAG